MKRKAPQHKYRLRNWSKYNAALVDRGNLTACIDEATLEAWDHPRQTAQRGLGPYRHSVIAIECMAMLKGVYKLTLRATEGLLSSVLTLWSADFYPYSTTRPYGAGCKS